MFQKITKIVHCVVAFPMDLVGLVHLGGRPDQSLADCSCPRQRCRKLHETSHQHLPNSPKAPCLIVYIQIGDCSNEVSSRPIDGTLNEWDSDAGSLTHHESKFILTMTVTVPNVFMYMAITLWWWSMHWWVFEKEVMAGYGSAIPLICRGSHGNTRVNFFCRCKFLQIYAKIWQFTV